MQQGASNRGQSSTSKASFLSLPQEVRDLIFLELVKQTDHIRVRDCAVAHDTPLSLACSQIRFEYEQIFRDEAPEYASYITICIKDFQYNRVALAWLDKTLPSAVSGVHRRYNVALCLSSALKRKHYVDHDLALDLITGDALRPVRTFLLRNIEDATTKGYYGYDISVYFDPADFTTTACSKMWRAVLFVPGAMATIGRKREIARLVKALQTAERRHGVQVHNDEKFTELFDSWLNAKVHLRIREVSVWFPFRHFVLMRLAKAYLIEYRATDSIYGGIDFWSGPMLQCIAINTEWSNVQERWSQLLVEPRPGSGL